MRFGSFTLSPQFSVGETYDDNIYATQADRVDDFITDVSGNLGITTDSPVLPASVQVSTSYDRYAHNPVEDYWNWSGLGSVGYVARDTTLNLSAGYLRDHESRRDPSFPTDALKAPAYDNSGGLIEVKHTFASGDIDASADYRHFSFQDIELPGGLTFSQALRDRDQLTFQGRANLVVHQSTTAFLQIIRIEQKYENSANVTDISSNSSSNSYFGGAAFRITNLMDGEVGIGLLQVLNSDHNQRDTNSLAVNSNIEFYVTPLLTATLNVQRTSGASEIQGSSSYIGLNGTAGLDYELLRNLIVSLKYADTRRTYSGTSKTDTTHTSTMSGRWLLNRSLNVTFSYDHASENLPFSAGTGRAFVDSVGMVTLNFSL